MRLMLDTCVIIDLLIDMDNLSKGAQELIEDPDNLLFASAESMRELVVHFNNKKLLNRYWKTSEEVLRTVEDELNIEFLPVRPDVGYAYSRHYAYKLTDEMLSFKMAKQSYVKCQPSTAARPTTYTVLATSTCS